VTRTRLDRVRASAGIAKLALQQIEDELTGEIGAQELAQILRELHHEDHRQDGVFGSIAQLLTVAARAAGRIEPDRDGEMSCPLHEAAALITENAGLQTYYATRALDPQGEAE
jgi:malate synthase